MYGIWEEKNNCGHKEARGAFGQSDFFSELGRYVYHLANKSDLKFELFEGRHDISQLEIENMSLKRRFVNQKT
jgi:hypothetical protein